MVYRYTSPFQQLRHEMDRLLSGLVSSLPDGPWVGLVRGQPAANVWEAGEAVMVEMEVPGIQGDQLDIAVVGGELSVKINRPESAEENVTYHRRERPTGEFIRVLRLPAEVDASKVEAALCNGVLTITLPKAESAKPRRIAVTAAK